jgi:hypothetical protein
MSEGKRQCYWIEQTQSDPHGFIPSVVTENEPGHTPLRGDPATLQAPWYWGKTLDEAEATCDRMNRERFGLSPREANEIVLSSMFPR